MERELAARGGGCADCGKPLTVASAHWHHHVEKRVVGDDGVERLVIDKHGNIADMIGRGLGKLIAELAKCVPLCERPCHLEGRHGHPPLTS